MNKTSEITQPFEVAKSELLKLVDSYLPDTIFESEEKDDLPISIKIFKGELSKIDISGKDMDITLSLDIEMDKSIGFISASAKGELQLDLYTQIDIDENWHLSTKTTLVNYKWIEKPKIDLIGFKFSASKWAEQYIDDNQLQWINQIDSIIANANILEKKVDTLFQIFNKPFPIDSSGNLAIRISPKKVEITPFISKEDSIQGGIKILFHTDLVLMNNLNTVDSTRVKFFWNTYEDFQQKSIFTLTLDQLRLQRIIDNHMEVNPLYARQFEVKGNKIEIKHIDLLFDDELIGAKVDFSGDKSGEIKILNRPYWDENKNSLVLLDRKVNIKMNDLSSKIILTLFGKSAKKKLIQKIEEQFNAKIIEIINDTNKSIKNISLENSIQIIDYKIPIQVEEKMLLLDIYLNISGNLNWNGLNVKLKSK